MINWAENFNTYEEACEFYGCDTPAQLALEDQWNRQKEIETSIDAMEARGGPIAPRFNPDCDGSLDCVCNDCCPF